jgi:hypothetical protein
VSLGTLAAVGGPFPRGWPSESVGGSLFARSSPPRLALGRQAAGAVAAVGGVHKAASDSLFFVHFSLLPIHTPGGGPSPTTSSSSTLPTYRP